MSGAPADRRSSATTSIRRRSSTGGRCRTARPGGCAGRCSGCSSPRASATRPSSSGGSARQPGVTRPNTIALISPKGGVGKTTSTFIAGNLLATHLKLRAIAVDANPDFGTLARLAPDDRRSERSLADLLDDADRLNTAAELAPYVSRLPTGLHVLGAPRDAELTASLGPDRYGELVAFLATFYEVVLLDLGTGVAGPLARFAIERADQVVLVTTPEWVTSTRRARGALAPAARPHDRRDQQVAPATRPRST